jgi:chromosome segregation ATPase
MLNARTEVADLDIKLRDVEEQLATSQEQERDAINSHKEIRDQLEILDKDNVEAKAKLAMENEKNTELGAELLTLVNQKETFGKMNASLNAKCETQEGKLRETEEVVEKRNKEVAELKESLEKEKLELENVRGEKQKVELELRKAVVGFEQSRLDLDKNVSQQRSGREESAQEHCGWISWSHTHSSR